MIVSEYKRGREKKLFVREHEGMYFLEKITKNYGFTIFAGTNEDMEKYLEENNYKFVGLVYNVH